MTVLREVDGWPGYSVGDDGSVWSCRTFHGTICGVWRRLRPRADRDGYLSVTLCNRQDRKTVKVAHLVLAAFVGPRPDGAEAAHWPNVDPADNRLVNLRWATHRDNAQDKVRGGTAAAGESHGCARLTEDDVRGILIDRQTGMTIRALAEKYGVSTYPVWAILRGKNWTHVPEVAHADG